MELAKKLKPISVEEVKSACIASRNYIDAVYLHWSAGRYGQVYEDYHVSIDYDGRIYFPDNDGDFTVFREHTWKRNTGSVGIALCGCFDATANNGINCDFGSNPVTQSQIEIMSWLVAMFVRYAGVDMDSVLTHCEAAFRDGYGPYSGDPETRWDLWFLPDSGKNGKMMPGGDTIRGKAQWYLNQI